MPCDTKVMVNVEKTKWTELARKKLGLPLTGGLDQKQAARVRIEAGKLKAVAVIKAVKPTALIQGLAAGENKIRIQISE
jgi:hypothetical protein